MVEAVRGSRRELKERPRGWDRISEVLRRAVAVNSLKLKELRVADA